MHLIHHHASERGLSAAPCICCATPALSICLVNTASIDCCQIVLLLPTTGPASRPASQPLHRSDERWHGGGRATVENGFQSLPETRRRRPSTNATTTTTSTTSQPQGKLARQCKATRHGKAGRRTGWWACCCPSPSIRVSSLPIGTSRGGQHHQLAVVSPPPTPPCPPKRRRAFPCLHSASRHHLCACADGTQQSLPPNLTTIHASDMLMCRQGPPKPT